MKSKNIRLYVPVALMALIMLGGGCKPTERNYREAYDAAIAKREKAEADIFIPEGGLESLDGPRTKKVGDITVYYEVKSLRWTQPADVPEGGNVRKDAPRPQAFNVAVGLYKMAVNAASQVDLLTSKGYSGAFPAHVGKDENYAVAASFPTLEEAAAFAAAFLKDNKGMNYVGLPGAPVVIESNLRY